MVEIDKFRVQIDNSSRKIEESRDMILHYDEVICNKAQKHDLATLARDLRDEIADVKLIS